MGTPKGCPYGLGALPSPLMHPLRGCIWGQGPKGPPCPHYRATFGGPLKNKRLFSCAGRCGCPHEQVETKIFNLGQKLHDVGQSVRLSVCPPPTRTSWPKLNYQPKELNCTIMLVFVLVLVLLLMLKSNLIYFTERGIWLTF